METFALVHGAWCWQPLVRGPEERGHRAIGSRSAVRRGRSRFERSAQVVVEALDRC